ncbi:MAG: hypothetical protein R2754_12760 [Microthrixaceae bacterium]
MAPHLAEAFGFTEDDLINNRSLRLSPAQERVHSGTVVRRRVVYAVVGLVGLAVAAALAYPAVTDGVDGNLGLVAGAVAAAVLGLLFLSGLSERPSQEVWLAEGAATLVRRTDEDGDHQLLVTHHLVIGEDEWQVSAEQLEALTQDDRYRVYHGGMGRRILSIERVGPPAEPPG